MKLRLSARAYHRVLRIARTVADLAGSAAVETAHVSEAIRYRSLDRLLKEQSRAGSTLRNCLPDILDPVHRVCRSGSTVAGSGK